MHKLRVPGSKAALTLVLDFVRSRRQMRTRVVAKDVLALLTEHGLVRVNMDDKKDAAAALRATQAFLVRKGFKRGKQKGVSYGLSTDVAVKRDSSLPKP
ncbi:hypothetical protein ACHHYP_20712 [Achlya hypogyna]|uniref:Uncharacterized protein n=1 Tax=Achlya hypogyna TaxID=1202772 RepID=A0A1V9YE77_ACHHY|nr:hypothetical protein ACHHYP_20712 [Achlya hypogyna]